MNQLEKIRRIILTGLAFALFGLGCIVLSLVVLPLQRVIYQNSEQRKKLARKTVHLGFRWFMWVAQSLKLCTVSVEQAQQYKNMRGQVVLANHPCLIDVVLLISLIPNADCVVKAHLFKNPFIRGVINCTGYITNSDPEGLILDCEKSLLSGNNLIIFPEGTRSDPEQTFFSFQRGAANIILRTGAPFKLFKLSVTPSTLTKSDKWYDVPPERFVLSLSNMPVSIDDEVFREMSPMAGARALTKRLEKIYTEELFQNVA